MISFAGGLPAAATFPNFDWSEVPRSALQYGATEGDSSLREIIANSLAAQGLHVAPAQVLVLSGSQQGIDLVAKLLIDAGTPVAVESPTYLAALQVFRLFGADLRTFQSHDIARLAELRARFAYINPTFQNPTGACYSSAQRATCAAACDESGTVLFEDDPYRDLAYDECSRTPVCSLLTRARWIYQGSFSKSLAPGLRLGFLACSEDLAVYLGRLKQAADLHSNRLSQHLVMTALRAPNYQTRLAEIISFYRQRRDAFAAALALHFDGLARWSVPRGGLFFWLELLNTLDTRALLPRALAQQVAFMPGEPFFADEKPGHSALRLNFSHAEPADAERGLAILATLIRTAREP